MGAFFVCAGSLGYPELSESHARVHTGFLVMSVMLTVWCVLPFKEFEDWAGESPRLALWAPSFAVATPLLVVVIAWLGIVSHDGAWVHGAHKRFGEEPTETTP